MANIAALAVQLSANISEYQAAMKKAAGATQGFTDSFTSGIASIAKWTSVIAGATAAVGAFFTKLGADKIDQTAKLADRLGGTTEEVGALQYAADLAGSSAETMAGALDKLNKNLGDPSKETLEALGMMGIKLEDIVAAGPQRRLEMIADGMSKLHNNAQRAAVATDLLGKQGMELMAVLEGGSAGIREMADEAQRAGVLFSRVDAAKVEIANDSIDRMKASFQGLFQRLAIEFAPFIASLAERMAGLGQIAQQLAPQIITAMRTVVGAVGGAIDAIAELVSELGDLVDSTRYGFAVARGDLGGAAGAMGSIAGRELQRRKRPNRREQFTDAFDAFLGNAQLAASSSIVGRFIREGARDLRQRLSGALGGFAAAGGIVRAGAGAAALAQNPVLQGLGSVLRTMFFSDRTPLVGSEVFDQDKKRLDELAFGQYAGSRALAQMFGERGLPERARTVGASGTFGSLGARMTSAQTIAQQQLDVARSQLDVLREIDSGLDAGVPAP